MIEWQQCQLGDCLTLISGGTPSKARNDFWGGDIPWVSCKDMKVERIYDTEDHLTSLGAQNGTRIVPENTILFVVRGMILAREFPVAITKRAVAFNQDLKAVKPAHFINTDFLFHWLRANTYEILGRADEAGHGTKRIQTDRLLSLPIDVPPLSVQCHIAGILTAYDDLIENSQRRIQILEAMGHALYREWFVHFRFPGHEKLPRVASVLGGIPEGWQVVSIEDVCERVTDGSHSSPKSVDEGMPMASSKDMHDWGFSMETCRFISRKDFDELVRNDCKPRKNDVLITKDGANYLKHIFVNRVECDVVLLSSIAILRPNARINSHLLAATLISPENKGRLKNYVTGAAIPRIVLKDFKRFQFVLPSKQVQADWAKRAEPLTELCWQLVDQIQNLRRTRDLLLPRLLSGQIDVEAA
jgi:type I restriction enzyme S subunit